LERYRIRFVGGDGSGDSHDCGLHIFFSGFFRAFGFNEFIVGIRCFDFLSGSDNRFRIERRPFGS
jgi:hypothetical protein